MSTFWTVLGAIGLVLLFLVLAAGVLIPPILVMLDDASPVALLVTLACLIGLAALIAVLINAGAFADDSASHCGVGTHYASSYNSSTETTDWWCVSS